MRAKFNKNLTHRTLREEDGVAMIEFAFILPIMLAITFGAIEYGMYFLKSNMNNNNVAAAARAVQADPGDPSNRDLLNQTSLINNADNKACAKSFSTLEAAKAAQCPPGLWDAMPPEDLPEGQTAYFVLIESNAVSKSLSGLFDEGKLLEGAFPANVARQVIKVSQGSNNDGQTCNGAPLLGKLCIGITESNCATGADRNGNQADCQYSRPILGLPACSKNGWTCEIYETNRDFRYVEDEVTLFDRCSPNKKLGKLEKFYNLYQSHPFARDDGRFEHAPSWCN